MIECQQFCVIELHNLATVESLLPARMCLCFSFLLASLCRTHCYSHHLWIGNLKIIKVDRLALGYTWISSEARALIQLLIQESQAVSVSPTSVPWGVPQALPRARHLLLSSLLQTTWVFLLFEAGICRSGFSRLGSCLSRFSLTHEIPHGCSF